MALEIVWTEQAEKGLIRVLEYLNERWTTKEIVNLEKNLQDLLARISNYTDIYPVSAKYKNVHKGLIDKNNYIIYRVDTSKNIIEIINFRGTKQNPTF